MFPESREGRGSRDVQSLGREREGGLGSVSPLYRDSSSPSPGESFSAKALPPWLSLSHPGWAHKRLPLGLVAAGPCVPLPVSPMPPKVIRKEGMPNTPAASLPSLTWHVCSAPSHSVNHTERDRRSLGRACGGSLRGRLRKAFCFSFSSSRKLFSPDRFPLTFVFLRAASAHGGARGCGRHGREEQRGPGARLEPPTPSRGVALL